MATPGYGRLKPEPNSG